MKKSSQNRVVDATAIPERVSVAMSEIAENMQEGLLALAVGAGLQVMQELMEADVAALAGPKGKHDATRTAVRHGRERGSVTLGGRRVPVTRPRVRAADGSAELAVASYELFTSTEILGRLAIEKMLAGLSTRRYPVGLEPVGQQVTEKSSATSKSAVSRRFVAMTVIQRCQIHKVRNVKDHLPQRLRSTVGAKMTAAYHADSALEAEAALLALANDLDRSHPSAAASLREGLPETLTVLRLGVPPTLARTLRSTNCIESMISVCRDHASNVKRWRDGRMALRWCAAGMVEAGKQFRRVNGHRHLPELRAALERDCAEPVGPVVHNDEVSAA